MKALRLKITLLVMSAIIAMSILGISAAASVASLLEGTPPAAVHYRISPSSPGTPRATVEAPLPAFSDQQDKVQSVVLIYAILIVICSAAVGHVVASMVVRPLSILERAVNSVDAEGFIPQIDEEGLGETLETAKLINRLSERLRSAMQSRMRLVAAAGHDLRTPMTRMRLRAEFIEDEETRGKWMRDIDELTHIADSAIRLVREEAFNEDMTEIQLDDLLVELCSELQAIGHDVSVSVVGPVRVRGGWHSLKRAASNLIVNAATHGHSAEVSLREVRGRARLTIMDNGPGIPDDKINQVFEPFFRADPSRQKNTPGAGLGLSISREIILRNKGTITIRNRKNGGLIQTVELPALD